MEQNMLPLWQPLSTVALILVVMEIPSPEGHWDKERPQGELSSGRGGGFSKTQDREVNLQKKKIKKNYIVTIHIIPLLLLTC